jgi:hypothetical protein
MIDDDQDPELIRCKVGNPPMLMVVSFRLFSDIHDDLADLYRSMGLRDNALDQAIVAALPLALAQALGIDHEETVH